MSLTFEQALDAAIALQAAGKPVSIDALWRQLKASGVRVARPWLGSAEENWELVALDYHPCEGWLIAQECSNFCGLLVPGQTLQEFEELSLCRAAHTTPLSPEERFDLVAERYARRADDGPPPAGLGN
jgi:hypothetical protein